MSHTIRLLIATLLFIACEIDTPPAARSEEAVGEQPRPVSAQEPILVSFQSAEMKLGKVGSQCRVVDVSFSTYARAGQTVRWLVDNGCTGEQRVEIVNILLKGTKTAVFPFQGRQPPPPSCTAPAGGLCQIVLVVLPKDPNGGHGNSVYTYDFNLVGKEPERVIEWP